MSGTGRPFTDTVVERIRSAPKYRLVHSDTIDDIVLHESVLATDAADLERRARLKLHRVVADYLFTAQSARVLRGLPEAVAAGPDAVRAWCRDVLARHFSTAERLPGLDELYPAILASTGPVDSIADLACALNPFTLPWLRAVSSATYTGYDLNLTYVELGRRFMELTGLEGTMAHQDVIVGAQHVHVDVALLLKTYHCIEDRKAGAALRLVDDLAATHVVVSFPLRTMSGRTAQFRHEHTGRLATLADQRGWSMRQSTIGAAEELVVITKSGVGRNG